jgi:hypothetical protein
LGRALQRIAIATAAAMMIMWLNLRHANCGRPVGWQADAAGYLFLLTVVLFMVGVVMATAAAQWAAIAAVAVADLGLLFLVAAIWACRMCGGGQAIRAKASEAGRVLTSGWVIVIVLQVAKPDRTRARRESPW